MCPLCPVFGSCGLIQPTGRGTGLGRRKPSAFLGLRTYRPTGRGTALSRTKTPALSGLRAHPAGRARDRAQSHENPSPFLASDSSSRPGAGPGSVAGEAPARCGNKGSCSVGTERPEIAGVSEPPGHTPVPGRPRSPVGRLPGEGRGCVLDTGRQCDFVHLFTNDVW